MNGSVFGLGLVFLLSLQSCWQCEQSKDFGPSNTLTGLGFGAVFKYENGSREATKFKFDSIRMKENGDTIIFLLTTKYLLEQPKEQECDYEKGHTYYRLAGKRFMVVAVGDFDSSHPDGSDISEYFLYDYTDKGGINGSNDSLSLDKYIFPRTYVDSNQPPVYYIRLIKRPASASIQFKLYNYTDNRDDGIMDLSPVMGFVR